NRLDWRALPTRLKERAKSKKNAGAAKAARYVSYNRRSSDSDRPCDCAHQYWLCGRSIGRRNFFISIGCCWQIGRVDEGDRLGKRSCVVEQRTQQRDVKLAQLGQIYSASKLMQHPDIWNSPAIAEPGK